MNPTLAITGLGALSALGHDLPGHRRALAARVISLRPLRELNGGDTPFGDVPAGWIEPRDHLLSRKWSPLSMAAIHVAGEALDAAGWSAADRATATVFFGTSRGSHAGWIDPWPARRPFDLLAATNSLPAEPAAAASAVHGIGGPWQVLSTGCCAGLDALAAAEMWIRSGRIQRALVIAVDLPLTTHLLDAYARTGLLARENHPGMIPAEAAAALCLERAEDTREAPQLLNCHAAADTTALVGSGREAATLARLLNEAATLHGVPDLLIPHASGTPANLAIETEAITSAFGKSLPLIPYKPHTGHAVAASGLLEMVLHLGGAHPPGMLPGNPRLVFKLASALGGRHSLACTSQPS